MKYLLVIVLLVTTLGGRAQKFSELSLQDLENGKNEAAKNENYSLAAKYKKAYEYKVALQKAVENEEFEKAAALKKSLQVLENGDTQADENVNEEYIQSEPKNNSYPKLDFINTVYLWDKNNNVVSDLEFDQPEITTKAGGFAYYAEATSYNKVAGASSDVKVKNGDSFLLKVAPGTNPQELFSLIQFDIMGRDVQDRYLPLFKSSTAASPFHASTNTSKNTSNERGVTFKKLGEGVFEVVINGIVAPGEYAFNGLNKMYSFSAPKSFSNSDQRAVPSRYNIEDIYKSPKVTWYGFDFSLFRYIDKSIADQEGRFKHFIEDWQKALDKKMLYFNFERWLRKEELEVQVSAVADNYKTKLDQDFIVPEPQAMNPYKIQELVKSYPEGTGHGLVYIPENINANTKYMDGYFVWFDKTNGGITFMKRIRIKGDNDFDDWKRHFEDVFEEYIDTHYKIIWARWN